jgi:hypothetical protein
VSLAPLQDEELTTILESFEADHCESPHAASDNKKCTHVPVMLQLNKCSRYGYEFKVCGAHVAWYMDRLVEGAGLCTETLIPWSECHTLVPLK